MLYNKTSMMNNMIYNSFTVPAAKVRTLAAGLFLAVLPSVAVAQQPADSVSLTSMTFVRQSFVRNFYNSSKVMSRINMDGTRLFLPDAANIVVMDGDSARAVSMRQEGRTLVLGSTADDWSASTLRVGAFHPYLCYEARFSGIEGDERIGIDFTDNEGKERTIRTMYHGGRVVSEIIENGHTKQLASKEVGRRERVSLRVQYTGVRFHVFLLGDDGQADLLYSAECDMRRVDTCTRYSFGVRAELPAGGEVTVEDARSLLTCGTGQADPQVVQLKDGSPLIRDGRLYVCMTTRGFERICDSWQGVYSIDLDSYELRLEGALFFGKGDGLMYGFHATKMVYDEDAGRFLVMTTTHEDTHTLAYSSSSADLLHGMHYLECTELPFPHSYSNGHGFNTEDPDFFFDSEAGRWRLAYCALKDGSYVTYLCESDEWNGPYRQVAESDRNNNTGIRITTVGGRRHVLSGGTGTTFYIYDYPSLRCLGTFNQQFANGGFRGWPTIVPVPYGNYERYLWITFDRGAQTGRYSYGTLYFYLGDKMWRLPDTAAPGLR